MAELIGKKSLAETLGWSRPRLDRRLTEDTAFPVARRGDQAGGWAFDLASVKAYLNGGMPPGAKASSKKKATPAPAVDKAQLRDAVAPPPASAARTVTVPPRKSAHHHGEATARQRKDNADAALRENKLRLENAELVDRSELRQELAKVLASIGNDLDGLPEVIAKLLELPDEAPRIRELIDKVRTSMVGNATALLADD